MTRFASIQRATARVALTLFASAGPWSLCLGAAVAQSSSAELAQQLSNPISSLISVPLQANYDEDIGPLREGERTTLNVQPVIPFALNKDWNLISRTIVPITSQRDIFAGSGSQSGLGDVLQSFFLSPSKPSGDWIWGAGPVFLIPTATDDLLGAKKWGAGPTAVVLRQQAGWTVGALANHVWSVAGDSDRSRISSTFLQPFLAYATKGAWTYSINAESSYDWRANDWSVPLNLSVSKVVQVGGQLVSVGGGVRYWASGPATAPNGFGFRLVVTLLFPG